MSPTYGDHQEAAASALNRLLGTTELPTAAAQVDRLLHCREAILDALEQRLRNLQIRPPATTPADQPVGARTPRQLRVEAQRARHRMLASLADPHLADTSLAQVLATTARLPRPRQVSPLDVLTPEAGDHPVVELWRQAAVELLCGSHTLETARERPWLNDPGAHWYLVADAAVTLEVINVLDGRLDAAGVTGALHPTPDAGPGRWPQLTGLEQRMVLSQCARAARWYATNDEPDLALGRHPETGHPETPGTVRLIRDAGDLAAGQRQLARYLRARPQYFVEPAMDVDTARRVTNGQILLCLSFERLCERHDGTKLTAREFRIRREILTDIKGRLGKLVDTLPASNDPALWQQQELFVAHRRLTPSGMDFNSRQLQDLASATHHVCRTFAKALLLDIGRHPAGNIRQIGDETTRTRHVTHRNPLVHQLNELAGLPGPGAPSHGFESTPGRTALSASLAATPPAVRRPPVPIAEHPTHRSPGRDR